MKKRVYTTMLALGMVVSSVPAYANESILENDENEVITVEAEEVEAEEVEAEEVETEEVEAEEVEAEEVEAEEVETEEVETEEVEADDTLINIEDLDIDNSLEIVTVETVDGDIISVEEVQNIDATIPTTYKYSNFWITTDAVYGTDFSVTTSKITFLNDNVTMSITMNEADKDKTLEIYMSNVDNINLTLKDFECTDAKIWAVASASNITLNLENVTLSTDYEYDTYIISTETNMLINFEGYNNIENNAKYGGAGIAVSGMPKGNSSYHQGVLTLSGATNDDVLNVMSTKDGSAIGASDDTNALGYSDYCGKIIIEQGIINAIAINPSYTAISGDGLRFTGAGIGGRNAEIEIKGGIVNAVAGYGAGIGSNWRENVNYIKISGDAVVNAHSIEGAGIGGSYLPTAGIPSEIEISGNAKVTASSITGSGIGAGGYEYDYNSNQVPKESDDIYNISISGNAIVEAYGGGVLSNDSIHEGITGDNDEYIGIEFGRAGIGGLNQKINISGNPTIITNDIVQNIYSADEAEIENHMLPASQWKGFMVNGRVGGFYGGVTSANITKDIIIPNDAIVVINAGETLTIDEGVTVVNKGTIINNSGTIVGSDKIIGNAVKTDTSNYNDPTIYVRNQNVEIKNNKFKNNDSIQVYVSEAIPSEATKAKFTATYDRLEDEPTYIFEDIDLGTTEIVNGTATSRILTLNDSSIKSSHEDAISKSLSYYWYALKDGDTVNVEIKVQYLDDSDTLLNTKILDLTVGKYISNTSTNMTNNPELILRPSTISTPDYTETRYMLIDDEAINVTAEDETLDGKYEFDEWTMLPEGATANIIGKIIELQPISDTWVYTAVANYVPIDEYTVTFDMNDSLLTSSTVSPTSIANQTIKYGETVTQPATPVRTGDNDKYVFAGWYYDEECTKVWNFKYGEVTEDVTLYAKWVEGEDKTVILETNSSYDADIVYIVDNNSYLDPALLPENLLQVNKKFTGWYTDSACTIEFNPTTDLITENTQLYAGWESATTHSVFLYSASTNSSYKTILGTVEGTKLVQPETPEPPTGKENYVFDGWYTEKTYENKYDFDAPVTAKVYLYANWVELDDGKVSVTFESNGATSGAIVHLPITSGGTISKPSDPTKTGYTFDAWYSDVELTTEFDFATIVSANTTLYAKWDSLNGSGTVAPDIDLSYEITFLAEDADDVFSETITLNNENKLDVLPTENPTRDGYTFNGWFTSKSGGTKVAIGMEFLEDTIVYAQWTLTGSDNGGDNDGDNGGGNTEGDTTPEVTPTYYTVTFNANGGTTATTSFETDEDGKLVTLPTATRSGYTFGGWYLADGTKVTTSTVFDENTTVTAKWTLNSTSGGGSGSGGSSSGGSSSGGSSSSGSGGNSSNDDDYYYNNDDSNDSSNSNSNSSNSGTNSGNYNTSGDGNYSPGTSGSGSNTTVKPPTTVVNKPIVTPAVKVDIANTETKVDEATGNTVTTITFGNGAEIVKETTPDGKTTIEVSGVDSKIAFKVPMETAPSPTQVVVIVKADGTREIVKDTIIDGDGFRITLDADAKIEVIDNAKDFGDVKAGSWYEDSVKFATSRELFFGMADGVFAPEGTMTRAMIWSVLYQYQGDGSTNGTTDDWFADAQAWSIAFGVSDGQNPNDNMTREQLVTILYRLGGDKSTTGNIEKFGDSTNVSDWASEAMNWAVAEGIIAGSNGNLNPKSSATRAEVAAIMMRFMEK